MRRIFYQVSRLSRICELPSITSGRHEYTISRKTRDDWVTSTHICAQDVNERSFEADHSNLPAIGDNTGVSVDEDVGLSAACEDPLNDKPVMCSTKPDSGINLGQDRRSNDYFQEDVIRLAPPFELRFDSDNTLHATAYGMLEL